MYLRIRHEEPDFNLLVDATLQISPAYNPEKSDKDKRTDKRTEEKKIEEKRLEERKGEERREREREREEQRREDAQLFGREQPSKLIKTEPVEHLEHNPVFSSSRLY